MKIKSKLQYCRNYKKEIEKVNKRIKEQERKRYSLPVPELTDIEKSVIKGLAEGRNYIEISNALHLINNEISYQKIIKILFKKFDALTLVQVIYKAVKIGII